MMTVVCPTNCICEYIYYMSVNKARYDALLMKKDEGNTLGENIFWNKVVL